jgi:hypothetical protein
VSLLYKTRSTSGRVLYSNAVHQGQPRIKRGLCLALVGALEFRSGSDLNSILSFLFIGLGHSRLGTSHARSHFPIPGTRNSVRPSQDR